MIINKRGFIVDIDYSAGFYVNVTNGVLFDNNSKLIYAPDNKKFKKILDSKKWIYYHVIEDKFIYEDDELSTIQLDTTHELLYPLCYLEVDLNGYITKYAPLLIDANFNVEPGEIVDGADVTLYRPIKFITETQLNIIGTKVTTLHPVYQLLNLYIYEMGDVILGSISYSGNEITLEEDVSPAVCEVTYAYLQ